MNTYRADQGKQYKYSFIKELNSYRLPKQMIKRQPLSRDLSQIFADRRESLPERQLAIRLSREKAKKADAAQFEDAYAQPSQMQSEAPGEEAASGAGALGEMIVEASELEAEALPQPMLPEDPAEIDEPMKAGEGLIEALPHPEMPEDPAEIFEPMKAGEGLIEASPEPELPEAPPESAEPMKAEEVLIEAPPQLEAPEPAGPIAASQDQGLTSEGGEAGATMPEAKEQPIAANLAKKALTAAEFAYEALKPPKAFKDAQKALAEAEKTLECLILGSSIWRKGGGAEAEATFEELKAESGEDSPEENEAESIEEAPDESKADPAEECAPIPEMASGALESAPGEPEKESGHLADGQEEAKTESADGSLDEPIAGNPPAKEAEAPKSALISPGFDRQGQKASPYIASLFGLSGEVSIIDASAGSQILSIQTAPYGSTAIAVSVKEGEVYAASASDDSIGVFSLINGMAKGRIATGKGPCALALDDEKGMLYAVNSVSGDIWAYSLREGRSPQAKVHTGFYPQGIALDIARGLAYIANCGSCTVTVVNTRSLEAIAEIEVGESPTGVCVNPLNGKCYISCFGQKGLTCLGPGLVPYQIPLDTEAVKVDCDPYINAIYATGSGNSLYIVDGGEDKLKKVIKTGYSMLAILTDPDGGMAYIADHTYGGLRAIRSSDFSEAKRIGRSGLVTDLKLFRVKAQ